MSTVRAFPLVRRIARAFAPGVFSVVLLVALAPVASAHAELISSDPSNGEVVAAAPSSITMSFSEPPDPDLSAVTLLDATGAQLDVGPLRRGVPARSLEIDLPPDLGDGVYTVSFIVVSEADGHNTPGVIAFGVGVSAGEIVPVSEAAEPAAPGPSPLAVAGKVLLYAGLAVSVGTCVTGAAAFGGLPPRRRWLLPASGAAAAMGAIVMTIAEAGSVGASLGELLASATGRSYAWLLVTTALTLGVATVAWAAVGGRAERAALVATGVAAAAAMLVRATSGHAAALMPALPAELAQFVHFVAIGVWVGGLLPMLLLVREHRDPAAPGPIAEVRRYSRIAGWAVLIVVGTGLARSVGEAGGVGGIAAMLTDTTYGTTLAVKVALALGLIGLGALNRRRSIPRLATDASLLRQVVTIELVAALGVFGLTGTLSSLNPDPPGDATGVESPAVTASGADFATTTRVTLTAKPGTAGPNTFEAVIVDYDDATPVAADEVTALFSAIGRPEIEPSTLTLEHASGAGSDDHMSAVWTGAGTQLSLAGAWDVVVQVRSGARTTEVPLVLVTRAPPTTSVLTQGSEDLPDIETFTLSSGQQLQVYLDPGASGMNELHVTAFDAGGDELPLSGLVAVAVGPDGHGEELDETRLTPGHFAAPAEVGAGSWRFEVVATTEGGTVLQAIQEQEIEP